MSDKAHMHGDRESHRGIVAMKRSNEGMGGPKEIAEGRLLTKENRAEPNPQRTPSRERAKWAGPCTTSSQREREDTVHGAAAPRGRRTAPQQLLPPEEEDGGSGRSDVARIWKRTGGAVSRPPWTGPWWSPSSESVTESLDQQRGWSETAIGDRGAGRQNCARRGGSGSQPDLGRGLCRFFVRIPAGAKPARRAGCAGGRDDWQERELCRGLGDPIIFRQSWLWQLRRRSQKHRWSWERFEEKLGHSIPEVEILHPYPEVRYASEHPR